MTSTTQSIRLKLFVLFACVCCGFSALAQDATSSQTTSTETHSASTVPATDAAMWYMNPIVWAIGGVVLLIIIIAAVSSGRKNKANVISRSTTTTTTVRQD